MMAMAVTGTTVARTMMRILISVSFMASVPSGARSIARKVVEKKRLCHSTKSQTGYKKETKKTSDAWRMDETSSAR